MGAETEDSDAPDMIGEALSNRAFRGIDKSRIRMVLDLAQRHGQVLCLVESDLARHTLARKTAEMSDAPVLAVIGEAVMRSEGIAGGREASYQRAESPDVAMSMLTGNETGPMVIFASIDQAAEMTLASATAAVILSAPADVDRVAAGLSCIDGLGKSADAISCLVLEDGLERSVMTPALHTGPGEIVAAAARQMRESIAVTQDGVADIMGDLCARLDKDVTPPSQGALPCHRG